MEEIVDKKYGRQKGSRVLQNTTGRAIWDVRRKATGEYDMQMEFTDTTKKKWTEKVDPIHEQILLNKRVAKGFFQNN